MTAGTPRHPVHQLPPRRLESTPRYVAVERQLEALVPKAEVGQTVGCNRPDLLWQVIEEHDDHGQAGWLPAVRDAVDQERCAR